MKLTEETINDRNTVNREANMIEGHLLRMLSPYQGQKVRKISGHGGNVAKLQAEFDRYCSDHGYNQQGQPFWLTLHGSYTSIIATLRDTSRSINVEIYLGRFDDQTGILTHLGDGFKRRTDYTLQKVEHAFMMARSLEDQARELRSSVREFA